MYEVLKAMGHTDTEEMNLDKIKTRTEDYENFLGSLEEISEELEINTGVYMDLEFMYEIHKERIESDYKERYEHSLRYYDRNPRALANVLIAMVMRTHAKIGEISLFLENSYEYLLDREKQTLDDMEQKANIQKEVCGLTKSQRPEIATDITDIFKEWDE